MVKSRGGWKSPEIQSMHDKTDASLSGELLSFIHAFLYSTMAPMKRRNAMIPKPRRARELASMRRRNSAKAVDLVSESESESGSESDEQEDEGVYEVERIVDHRMSRRYPVKC